MELIETKWKYWRMRIWSCCGFRWELLLSRKFPDRNNWAPVCSNCGSTMPTNIIKENIFLTIK